MKYVILVTVVIFLFFLIIISGVDNIEESSAQGIIVPQYHYILGTDELHEAIIRLDKKLYEIELKLNLLNSLIDELPNIDEEVRDFEITTACDSCA